MAGSISGCWTKSGSSYYVDFALVVDGALVTSGLSALTVTFRQAGTDLVFSGTPSAGASGVVSANGTLGTPPTNNRPVLVVVTATYSAVVYTGVLPGAVLA